LASNSNLPGLIYSQAIANGVPPSIALAVAQQESGVQQWTPTGDLVTGSAGEIGVFQLMPKTAEGLGVDPTDPVQNVQGGTSLLAQLYEQYGSWPEALSAYNSGSPTGSPTYANSVLAIAGTIAPTPADTSSASIVDLVPNTSEVSDFMDSVNPNLLVIGGLVVVGVALWWMEA
jgi:soluble lytic murein transglycosylase-like protein